MPSRRRYDQFLDEAADEGLDADEIHDTIVLEGRKISVITLIVDQGEQARYSQTEREILCIFEPNTTNPWLQESSGGE